MIEQPKLSPVPKLKLYILLKDYPAVYGDMKILIPKGFVFDGASIPFIGWLPTYTPFHPLVMASAICHDWIFLNHQTDQKTADQILYDRLVLNGASPFKSKLMYRAVRIGGGLFWQPGADKIKDLQTLYDSCKNSLDFDLYQFPVDLVKT